MSSAKKTASNRRNAQKSTGPISAAGKAVVSRNAFKHGLLSRHLIVEGESHEEFSELLRLLADEFQPIGMVEQALVERVGIALWRQRRLVRAESAEVSLNQQRFGEEQAHEVGKVLNLGYSVYGKIQAPEEAPEERDVAELQDRKRMWQSVVDEEISATEDPFSQLPEVLQREILDGFGIEPAQADELVKAEFETWADMFESYVDHYESLIRKQRIYEVSRLVMQSQALPSKTDLLSRYQTALDNDLYKALKALREAQAWRQARAVIDVAPASPDSNDTEE